MFVKSCNHKKVLLEIDVAKNGQNSRKIPLKEFVILCNHKPTNFLKMNSFTVIF